MPKVNLDEEDAIQKLNDYLRVLKPAVIEFKFAHDTNPLPYEVKKIMAGKSHIWYNTLWDTHAGGHDDDCSLANRDKGYGYLIDNLGATILQTDRPAYLIDYLKHKSKVMDCKRDWTYLQSENEYQTPFIPHFTVEECFLKSKKSPQTNEDGIIVTPYFAAVIDGATMKDLESHDPGREFIYPFLQKQAVLQNCLLEDQRFAFPVFDSFPVRMKQVNIFPVGDAEEVVLSSDGYPHLYSTLHESECYLADILEKDPLCMRLYKSTKGVQKGNCSFDDRAYLRIKINKYYISYGT